jgi:Tfp pilus assembly protein PilN
VGLRIYQHSLAEQTAAFELEQKAVASQVPALRAAAEVQQRWIGEPDWHEIFRGLTHQVPAEIYLTEWAVDGREVTFRGRVRRQDRSADEVLTRFTEALEQGAMTGVALRSSRQIEESSDQAEFEIGGRLR